MPWIAKEGVELYLTQSEMENNATIFYNIFSAYGYTLESICGMLGNIQQECTINPALKQGESTELGWGLIQWTPSTELTDYADSQGKNWTDGNLQCELINREVLEGFGGRWLPTREYPYSGEEFSKLTDVAESCKAFLYERERAGKPMLEYRLEYTSNWYTFLSGKPPEPPEPPEPPTPAKPKKMSIFLMLRRNF